MSAKQPEGFTLIELLLVIAIVALLSSVIMTSANSSRAKAADARIKSDLRAVVNQSVLHYTGEGRAFGTQAWTANATSFTPGSATNGNGPFFQDRTVGMALASVAQQGGGVSYASNDTSWIVISRLKTGGIWCIDSNATSGGAWDYRTPGPTYYYGTPAYRCR